MRLSVCSRQSVGLMPADSIDCVATGSGLALAGFARVEGFGDAFDGVADGRVLSARGVPVAFGFAFFSVMRRSLLPEISEAALEFLTDQTTVAEIIEHESVEGNLGRGEQIIDAATGAEILQSAPKGIEVCLVSL